MNKLSVLVLFALLTWSVLPSQAQQPIQTNPIKVSNKNASGTIAASNVFQSVAAADTGTQRGRTGCLIQNNGASKMWVFFGPIADALTPTAISLAAGASITCSTDSGGVITDQVSITGTSGQEFYAGFQ